MFLTTSGETAGGTDERAGRRIVRWRSLTAAVALLLAFAGAVHAQPRADAWKKVDEADRKGLPKTAIAELGPIAEQAVADHAYGEAIKATVRRIALQGQIDDADLAATLPKLQAAAEAAPPEMKPLMEAILAHGYWQYFQRNRWQLSRRTATATSGTDIATWDLARLLREIDRHFTAALANAPVLQRTPLAPFKDVIDLGTVPAAYRPTLFDFLSYEALGFYQSGEQGVNVAEDEFEIAADSPIFADPAAFMAWTPQTTDTESPRLKAIRVYQHLLRFHAGDTDRSAYLDADLSRLSWGENVAQGDDKTDRYEAALRAFIERAGRHPISSRGYVALARRVESDGDPATAHRLATQGYEAFPDTAGGVACLNLRQAIEAPSAQVETERMWSSAPVSVDVTYKNVTQLYFRAVPVDFFDHVRHRHWQWQNFTHDEIKALLARPASASWNAALPPTPDFKNRTEKVPVPRTLKPGFYLLLASVDSDFHDHDTFLCATGVWVSDLALVIHQRTFAPPSGLVVHADSGEPVANATVTWWVPDQHDAANAGDSVRTDANGRFTIPHPPRYGFMVAEHDGNFAASGLIGDPRPNASVNSMVTHAVFFTDRALYRPGQTIYYKGIIAHFDARVGEYGVDAGRSALVVFKDANGQEIAHATHTTNDFGSFEGVFTAPRDRLPGRMSLQVAELDGEAAFNVEEYKRPKFRVELNPPATAPKLNESVDLAGKATAYTGAAVGGAKVTWRVTRQVRVPLWCWWWRPPAEKAIAHGTTTTAADGTFHVAFTAAPDRSAPEKSEPVFTYAVHADVTDTNGETRSDDHAVRAGYTALQADVQVDEWQTAGRPVEITTSTASLDGEPQAADGTLTLATLRQPESVARKSLSPDYRRWEPMVGVAERADPAKPETWATDTVVATRTLHVDHTGKTQTAFPLAAGIYRATWETHDRFGKVVTARKTITVLDPSATRFPVKIANQFSAAKWSVEPGETFTALWGTGYPTGRAFVELERDGKVLRSFWTEAGRTQQAVTMPVTESMRGGFTVRVTSVRENRAYIDQRIVDVPWTNKELTIKWETFRSKLGPGEKNTWTAVVTGPNATRSAVEMVAAMYDASLDQFQRHDWPHAFSGFRSEAAEGEPRFANHMTALSEVADWREPELHEKPWRYPAFFPQVLAFGGAQDLVVLSAFSVAAPGARPETRGFMLRNSDEGAPIPAALPKVEQPQADMMDAPTSPTPADKAAITKTVVPRRNLTETAFFFPQLLSDKDGVVKIQFTAPETLTEWKFLGFAHDAQLRAGFLSDTAVTAKDLMVEPNAPRFVREGDVVEFPVKLTNMTDRPQTGTVRLDFADAEHGTSANDALHHAQPEQRFQLEPHRAKTVMWRIAVPDGSGTLIYKAVAAAGNVSDGEEGYVPVLSKRVLVTESLPLPIRGPGTKTFEFTKLLESAASPTLRSQSLTVQMVSQPAWYAVMALPYLMEFPYECSEQVFNRYYANALARHLATSNPKIQRVFELWKATPALKSPLEKNADLKSVALEETPWVAQAQDESAARQHVGVLFDGNRLDSEAAAALRTLTERQQSDGLWAWFPGAPSSPYISLYVACGFGRLRHLGLPVDIVPAFRAVAGLDAWMNDNYRRVLKNKDAAAYVPSSLDALYLYTRSFFLRDVPITPAQRAMVDFYLGQARAHWVGVASRQSQAHLALALQRFGDAATAQAIVKSLKERSTSSEELGMYWNDDRRGWWWYEAPIETQAMMIEAFDEVAHDAAAVEDCKTWLLKQKQTQDWGTTKATADAAYALLARGANLLASDARVTVSLGGQALRPDTVEAGTGFYEKRFVRDEVIPAMGRITVEKPDAGVSWGSVSWQYLEDMSKVTPHTGTPLQIKKSLFVKETTARGPVLKPAVGPVAVGDELVTRLELRTDRDMEFVHLKDQRASGTEPVDVISRYRYQDGLGYYQATRDTATHFFIDYLPRGTYVFEYSTRVQLKGQYTSGLAEIQCMYAPEFNSHSESMSLDVK